MNRFVRSTMFLAVWFLALCLSGCAGREAAREQDGYTVLIPDGVFSMGCVPGDSECSEWEEPSRPTRVDSFRIDAREVTVAGYDRCVRAGACDPAHADDASRNPHCNRGRADRADHPINCVDRAGAQAYCAWTGGRLPTEAEWEFAARGGLDGKIYPWGDENVSCERAVMDDGEEGCGNGGTWSVGAKPAGRNGYGLYDMAGNVWEWCADSDDGFFGVVRGGGWDDLSPDLRASARAPFLPDSKHRAVGFRCVRD